MQICKIAPCGANCIICMSYLKKENACPGCRADNENKPKTCIRCRIKNCDELIDNNYVYCHECRKFPCTRMKQLDSRYQKNYNFSMIENIIEAIELYLEPDSHEINPDAKVFEVAI